MKKIFIFMIMFSFSALARPDMSQFNRMLNEDVQDDVKKEETDFKKNNRAPASIETSDTQIILDQQKNLDKSEKNLNQLGPKKW